MKKSTRRSFIRNASLTATGLAVASYSGAKKKVVENAFIGCAPLKTTRLTGSIASVKSGRWSDPATWGGKLPAPTDTPLISSSHLVTYDIETSTVAGLNISNGAILEFDPSKSTTLLTTRNIIVQGKLQMTPGASANQTIRFVGVDESRFVGGGMDPLETDTGLWVMGAGKLEIAGTTKKAWTRATGSINAGNISFTVQDASGWKVGDTIVVVPTDMPGADNFNWNDLTNQPVDPFAQKFERRTIVAISGNTITVNTPFTHDHLQVVTDTGKTWTAEVANLSRNVNIEGTATGRAHIFIRSSVPQSIKYLAGRYLGPRKKITRTRPELVSGRYGLHFHHCMDGSRGSIVEGCALFDIGNRVYVPHMSHGITMKNNVSFNSMEAAFWWDFQELSHDINWDGNLIALVSLNGIDSSSLGMMLNMGDGNVARNNVCVYGHNGDEHGHGGYTWEADSEGVWIFENNLSHSNRCGLFVWQNTSNNHTIVNQESYNDYLGVFHGAYSNSYTYTGGYFYNSICRVKATSGNASGVRFEKIIFDGAGKLPFVTEVFPSPITSGENHNAFRECTFKNYTEVGLRMNTFLVSNENGKKHVDLIKCTFSGKQVDFSRESIYESKVFIQPASGQCTMVSQAGVTNIAPFAPYLYGTGNGLKGEYYNGCQFESFAFSRVDSMIMFQQWTYDKKVSPTCVHYAITNKDLYSVRWTGKIEAQYTEPYQFRVEGSGGFRLWINNVKVIDSWIERADNKDSVVTPAISMVAGQKYDIKLEHMNQSGARACQLFWQCPSLGRWVHVPQSQLYSDANVITTPPAPTNQGPVANAGADVIITLPTSEVMLNGTASVDPDGTIAAFKWTKVSGPSQFSILKPAEATTVVNNLVQGTYIFRLQVTDDKGATHEDDVVVTVNPKPATEPAPNQKPIANAGADIVVTLPENSATLNGSASRDIDGTIKSFKWTKVSGPTRYKIANPNTSTTSITNLVEGTYVFRLTVTDDKGATAEDDVMVIVNRSQNKTTSQQTTTTQTLKVTVAPNPTTTQFTVFVESGSDEPITLSLFNRYGILILTIKCKRNTSHNFGRNLKPGTYFGVAEQGTQKISMTLMKL